MTTLTQTDGRRARRDRSRQAVIDVVFALTLEGKGPPSAEAVAERAGVSVSSIFRNFDGLVDLQNQAMTQFQDRYSHLLFATPPPSTPLEARTAFFVRNRLDLYEQAGPLLAIARARAIEHQPMVEAVARNRASLADQTRSCFVAELAGRTPAAATNLVSMLDSFTSPESFELLTSGHSRTRRQIERLWTPGLLSLHATWPAPSSTEPPSSTDPHVVH